MADLKTYKITITTRNPGSPTGIGLDWLAGYGWQTLLQYETKEGSSEMEAVTKQLEALMAGDKPFTLHESKSRTFVIHPDLLRQSMVTVEEVEADATDVTGD